MWFGKNKDEGRGENRRSAPPRGNTRRDQVPGAPAIPVPKWIWIPAVGVLAVLLGALLTWKIGSLLFWDNPAYAITSLEIHIEGQTITPGHVREYMGVCEGTNIFSSSLQTLRTGFLKKTPIAKSVTLHRHLPGTLAITVVERTPIARLGRWGSLAVDYEGHVFNLRSGGRDYPIIAGCPIDSLKPGGCVDQLALNALELIDCCNRSKLGERIKLASLDVTRKEHIEAFLQGGERIKIGWPDMELYAPDLRQKAERKLVALAAALRASEERGKKLVNLDLTFTDQYIPGQEF